MAIDNTLFVVLDMKNRESIQPWISQPVDYNTTISIYRNCNSPAESASKYLTTSDSPWDSAKALRVSLAAFTGPESAKQESSMI